MNYDYYLLIGTQRSFLDIFAQTILTGLVLAILSIVGQWLAKNGKNFGINFFSPLGDATIERETDPGSLPLHKQSMEYLVGRLIRNAIRFCRENPAFSFLMLVLFLILMLGGLGFFAFTTSE